MSVLSYIADAHDTVSSAPVQPDVQDGSRYRLPMQGLIPLLLPVRCGTTTIEFGEVRFMQLNYRRATRFLGRQFVRLAWTTTQQKWTTAGICAATITTIAFVPNLGIAIFGTAFAGWWVVLFVTAMLGGLAGNRVGVGREKAALLRQTESKNS